MPSYTSRSAVSDSTSAQNHCGEVNQPP